MRGLVKVGVVLSCLVLLPAAVFAQAGIAGNVKDSSGAVLPGVTVEAASPALIEKTRSVVTDGSGNYKIENIRPGTYSVTFTLPGFNTVKRDGIELAGSFVATVNADMKVGAIEETITVTGETPIVDIQSTARQQVLNKDTIEAIPTGRNYSALGVLLPGVVNNNQEVGGNRGGNMDALTIHGSATGDQRILQNGLNVMTLQTGGGNIGGMVPNQSGAQEVAVDTDATSAERQTSGVTVNYIQRDGGNTFKSYSFFTFSNENLASSNLSSRVETGPYGAAGVSNAVGLTAISNVKTAWEVNPSFGGPIKKDKIWYYYALRYQRNQNYAAGMFQNANAFDLSKYTYVPTTTQSLLTNGYWDDSQLRLTWQANPKNKFAATWDQQAKCECPGANLPVGPTRATESTVDYRFPTQQLIHAEWFSPITSRVLVEVVALHRTERWGNMDLTPADQRPQWPSFGGGFDTFFPLSAYALYPLATGNVEQNAVNGQAANLTYRGPAQTFNNNWVPSYHYRGSVSYVTGSHAYKVGFQDAVGYIQSAVYTPLVQPMVFRSKTTITAATPLDANGFYQGAPNWNQVTYFATPYESKNDQHHDIGIYAQDKWTLKKLTFNYGLRFDYFSSAFPDQTLTPATPLVALSVANGGSGITPRNTLQTCATNAGLCGYDNLTWKDISPRFGAAYDLRGDGKTAIKGSAGKYVAGVTANGTGATANPIARLINSANRTWTDGLNGSPKDNIPQCDPLNIAANGECGAYTGANVNFGTLNPNAVTDSSLKSGWGKRGSNWEFSAGVQQQVMPRVSVDVSYFRRVFAGFTVVDNLNLAPSNFDTFSVIAPVDPRLGDRSGQTITGFYDVNTASKSIATNNSTVLVKDLPGSPNQIQHWNGVDVSANARLQNGILLQGGISTGRTSTNNCDVVALVPEALGNTAQSDCAVTTQFLTQAKVIAVYTVPKVAVQIAATFQSLPGTNLTSVFTLTNANSSVAPGTATGGATLGRGINAAGAQKTVNLLPGDTPLLSERLNQLDLRFAKILRYGKTRTNVSVDIFNSLNADTITAFSAAYETLWRPSALLQSRFVKFSAQFDF